MVASYEKTALVRSPTLNELVTFPKSSDRETENPFDNETVWLCALSSVCSEIVALKSDERLKLRIIYKIVIN